jgi:ornithine carbamoyltransferase
MVVLSVILFKFLAVASRLQVDLVYPDLMVKMGEMEHPESQVKNNPFFCYYF